MILQKERSSLVEKDLVGKNLDISQKCVLAVWVAPLQAPLHRLQIQPGVASVGLSRGCSILQVSPSAVLCCGLLYSSFNGKSLLMLSGTGSAMTWGIFLGYVHRGHPCSLPTPPSFLPPTQIHILLLLLLFNK